MAGVANKVLQSWLLKNNSLAFRFAMGAGGEPKTESALLPRA